MKLVAGVARKQNRLSIQGSQDQSPGPLYEALNWDSVSVCSRCWWDVEPEFTHSQFLC